MLTKVQNPKHYAVPYNKEVAKKDVISIIDDEGFLREVSFSDLTDHPTTISGYGITDAYISNGTIYLGNESITPASVSSLGTAAYKDYTTSVTQGGVDLPTSDAVFQAIGAAVSSALHYRGISSTVITDGGTETAVIGGQPLIAQSGDVVIYSGFEFLWENNVWNKLGDDTSFALKTVQITGDGTYITGGGDLTTNRTLGLTQAVIDDIAEGVTAYGWGDHSQAGYLTTETDPTVPAWAKEASKPSYNFSEINNKPTTISGYGITDAKIEIPSGTTNRKITLGSNNFTIYSWALASTKPSYIFSEIGSKPTTIDGYGITDAKIVSGTITLGSDSITPLTSFTETDPVFSASEAANITSTDTTNWDTAYGWGDHSQVGYLTSETDPTVPLWAKQANKPSYNFSEIGNTPTTLGGYGITDAHITSGTITLGSDSITPLTSFTETDPIYSASAASGIQSSDISNWNGKYTKPVNGIPASDLEDTYLTSETDPTVPSWAKEATKPSYTASEVGALPDTTHIPDDMLIGIVVGKLYRDNVSGTGNITIAGNSGYIPTTSVAGTYRCTIHMLSTTQTYSLNVTYGSNTYSLSTTNGVISDSRELTVAANASWSASIPGSTPVAAGTYLTVALYSKTTVAKTIGVAAVTNNYNDLNSKPTIPTVNNATLTIQKNGTNVTTFTANASSNATANITVPTAVSELSNDSKFTPSSAAIPYIVGPDTDTTAGTWTGTCADITAYTEGLTIIYVPHVAGVSSATYLNINGLGSVQCFYTGTSALGTHFPVGTPILFTYHTIGGVAGWRRADYNADTTNARQLNSYYERGRLYSTSAPLYRYKICGYRNGKIVPITITNQTSATQVNKVPTDIGLDVARGLTYYNSTTAVEVLNGTIGAQALQESALLTTAAYTFNVSVSTYTDVYLQGSYDVDTGLFILDRTQTSGNYRSYYVLAPKASGSYTSVFTAGKYYWFVGAAYSTANYIQLKVVNPLYYFDGSNLVPAAGFTTTTQTDTDELCNILTGNS